MQLDLSRDYLDALLLQHPPPKEGNPEVKVNGGLHFLPSSPDKKLHTAVASFALNLEGEERPFAQGGWRFLFTSSEAFDPEQNSGHPFLRQLLVLGTTKIMTVINPLCLHANMPVIPIDPNRMAQSAAQPEQGDSAEQA
jgi:hypothetical protein